MQLRIALSVQYLNKYSPKKGETVILGFLNKVTFELIHAYRCVATENNCYECKYRNCWKDLGLYSFLPENWTFYSAWLWDGGLFCLDVCLPPKNSIKLYTHIQPWYIFSIFSPNQKRHKQPEMCLTRASATVVLGAFWSGASWSSVISHCSIKTVFKMETVAEQEANKDTFWK